MTQKKDRRSARTIKRESKDSIQLVWAPPQNTGSHLVRSLAKVRPDLWISTPASFDFCSQCLTRLPSLPRSYSSSAPTVPEVSQ